MCRYIIILIFFILPAIAFAQLVEVQANYNNVGDVDFVAYNNTAAPLFVTVDLADLENTTINEPLPVVRILQPGFNTLFTLFRDPGAEVPRFNHQIKVFRSNPLAHADLNHPYLIPLTPGMTATVKEVASPGSFSTEKNISSWHATGFSVNPNQDVFAARTGVVVEIVGAKRTGDPQTWYHNWVNSITVLQPDGTLVSYRHVVDTGHRLKIGHKIFAGQLLGKVAPGQKELVMAVFQHNLNSSQLNFIIPQFIAEDHRGILLSGSKYQVIHPKEILGMEMTGREIRRYMK